MRHHLDYVEPVRSYLGTWKFDTFRASLSVERRKYAKQLGRIIARNLRLNGRTPQTVVSAMFDAYENSYGLGILHYADYRGIHETLGKMFGPELFDALRRDVLRLESDHWEKPLFARFHWFTESPHAILHSVHMSVSENTAGMVAFAETPDKLRADRFTLMKPGRYLNKYFSDKLSESDIREIVQKMDALLAPADLRFIEGNDRDGWVRVYRDGPTSCMSGGAADYVEVYAHNRSVLRLAYLVQGDDNIAARCIVREDTKQWIRCYPNTNSTENQRWYDAMKAAVESAGYTPGGYDKVDGGEPVLLAAIEDDQSGFYRMPYVDYGHGGPPHGELVMRDGEPYIAITGDGYSLQVTSGRVRMEGGDYTCYDCEEEYDEDDGHYLGYMDRWVCEHCRDNNYTFAIIGGSISRPRREYIPEEQALCPEGADDYYDGEDTELLNRHGYYMCEETGDWYHEDDMVLTSRGYIKSGHRCLVELDKKDSDGNEWAHRDDTVTTEDGLTIHEDDALDTYDGRTYHKDAVVCTHDELWAHQDEVLVIVDNYGDEVVVLKSDAQLERIAA
jgi:hypothetical protein